MHYAFILGMRNEFVSPLQRRIPLSFSQYLQLLPLNHRHFRHKDATYRVALEMQATPTRGANVPVMQLTKVNPTNSTQMVKTGKAVNCIRKLKFGRKKLLDQLQD